MDKDYFQNLFFCEGFMEDDFSRGISIITKEDKDVLAYEFEFDDCGILVNHNTLIPYSDIEAINDNVKGCCVFKLN